MAQFLTVSEIDTAIQQRMSGQAPDQTKRLAAINDAMQDIYAEFDIDSGKRDLITYIVFDGQPIKISGLVDDFKRVSDLRFLSPSKQNEEFSYVDDDLFTVHLGEGKALNEYSVAYNNGNLCLKANTNNQKTYVQLHSMGNTTVNGTWVADTSTSDASNLTNESVIALNQGTNISFDIDVSQSVNNYSLISVSDMASLDLSEYANLGLTRFWIKIPSVTNFTSVELRWGNDSSNYYSVAATTQADGSALIAGWNFISINWADATETGSVDNTDVDYLALVMNYTASYTDQTGFKVEALNMFLPEPVKLVYWTYYLSQDSSGNFQEDGTTTSGDVLLLPRRFKKLLVTGALIYLWPEALGDDAELQVRRAESKYDKEVQHLDLDIADRPKTPAKKLKFRKDW